MRNWLLFFVIIAVLLSCARPPWRRIYRDRNIKTFESVEYAWLWDPPAKASAVDFGRVSLQVGALLFLGGCIVFSRYIFRPTKKKTKIQTQTKTKMPTEKQGKKWLRASLWFLAVLLPTGYSVGITLVYLEIESKYMFLQETTRSLEKTNRLLRSNLRLIPVEGATAINLPRGYVLEGQPQSQQGDPWGAAADRAMAATKKPRQLTLSEMAATKPDIFDRLAAQRSQKKQGSFDPDAYLASKASQKQGSGFAAWQRENAAGAGATVIDPNLN